MPYPEKILSNTDILCQIPEYIVMKWCADLLQTH